MRSFAVVVLLAVALALATFAPVASAGANLTVYNDDACSQLAFGPSELPLQSSDACWSLNVPPIAGSLQFWCYEATGAVNMSVQAWQSVNNCSGPADFGLSSLGKSGACVPLTLTLGGQPMDGAWATVQCLNDDSQAVDGAQQEKAVQTLSELAQELAATMTERKVQRRHTRLLTA